MGALRAASRTLTCLPFLVVTLTFAGRTKLILGVGAALPALVVRFRRIISCTLVDGLLTAQLSAAEYGLVGQDPQAAQPVARLCLVSYGVKTAQRSPQSPCRDGCGPASKIGDPTISPVSGSMFQISRPRSIRTTPVPGSW